MPNPFYKPLYLCPIQNHKCMSVHYEISYRNPATQYIDIQMTLENISDPEVYIRMSAWRPGRYELGNFTKNIRSLKAYNEKGELLPVEKTERERWKVSTHGASRVIIRYDIFGGQLNAGSTYLDDAQLYMNPVNSFLYAEGREQEECILEFQLPADYVIATGMGKVEGHPHSLKARNFDQLADSPLIASASLTKTEFTAGNILVHCWFQGSCKPDMERIKIDFRRFIEEQVHAFGGFPEQEFHFLFQITPHKSHHGVEHENSTVCMIGPTYALMNSQYDEFLELSSHEFYHSWNIKKIRPVEMMPYDFTRENYFRTGYVAEGVTTYYGDIMLFRSKVFTKEQYFNTVHDTLKKHFHNYGRLNMPVSEASFDSWVDGYEAGVPHRKTSIYTEGALCAMMEDILIIHHSGRKYSLDNVMKDLYHEYAVNKRGYTTDDYRSLIEKYSGIDFNDFFSRYVYGCESFEEELNKCLNLVGLTLSIQPSVELYERNYGFKVNEDLNKVINIAPNSPAYEAGLMIGDIVATLNGFSVTNNMKQWFRYLDGDDIQLRVRTMDGRIKHLVIPASKNNFFPDYTLKTLPELTDIQKENYERWSKNGLPAVINNGN